MSNNSRKVQDPTEAAMSAIQEALSVRDAEMKAAAASRTTGSVAPEPQMSLNDQPKPVEPRRPAMPASARFEDEFFIADTPMDSEPGRPANDDWRTAAQILQTAQGLPSTRKYYVMAGIASAVWVALALILAMSSSAQLQANFAPTLLALVVTFIAPVAFFFAAAHTVARSQEMRALTQSMTEVALRLSEPEGVAREAIVSVGQAIRREVAAMGDGVERALARAAELEVLVQNEVGALERAYNDNEVRIRGLLDDLAAQRDSLIGQAEQVRNAITGVHLALNQDITGISDRKHHPRSDGKERTHCLRTQPHQRRDAGAAR